MYDYAHDTGAGECEFFDYTLKETTKELKTQRIHWEWVWKIGRERIRGQILLYI